MCLLCRDSAASYTPHDDSVLMPCTERSQHNPMKQQRCRWRLPVRSFDLTLLDHLLDHLLDTPPSSAPRSPVVGGPIRAYLQEAVRESIAMLHN